MTRILAVTVLAMVAAVHLRSETSQTSLAYSNAKIAITSSAAFSGNPITPDPGAYGWFDPSTSSDPLLQNAHWIWVPTAAPLDQPYTFTKTINANSVTCLDSPALSFTLKLMNSVPVTVSVNGVQSSPEVSTSKFQDIDVTSQMVLTGLKKTVFNFTVQNAEVGGLAFVLIYKC